MAHVGKTIGRRAAKATVKHTARGVKAKAQRKPLRSFTLLGLGAAVGAAAGFAAGRLGAPNPQ